MSKSVQRDSSKKHYAKRLLSYTTAAGLGALGVEHDANAAVVFLDIPDVTLSSTPVDPFSEFEANEQPFDLNNDGSDDILFQARYRALNNKNIDNTAGAGDTSVRRQGTSSILVPVAQSYYVGAFAAGMSIGPTTATALTAAPDYQLFLSLSYRYPDPVYAPYYSYNGGQFGTGYVGLKFNIGSSPHFGWAEVETNPGGELVASVTIKSFAYESIAHTAILAGETGGGGGIDGDFDGDGDVDGRDFLVWQRGGTTPPLDPTLLTEWQNNYGTGSLQAMTSAVPEPCTLALLAGGSGALAFTRRKPRS